MQSREIIKKIAFRVQQRLKEDATGHDWWHIYRVWMMSKTLQKKEGGDLFIIELAALLHDIADWKLNNGKEEEGYRTIENWLTEAGLGKQKMEKIIAIIRQVSFKGAEVETPMSSMEGKIVQDADRLDAIGAIGISRAFAYGGNKNRMIYDPGIQPEMHTNFEAYKKAEGTTVNHFYEKLLLLKERMNTTAAKEIAAERHAFMETFLERFYREWDGKL